MGNLHSLVFALRRVGAGDVVVANKAKQIAAAQQVALPGDGHFDACMKQVDKLGLRNALKDAATSKPFLGVCVGMQALFAGSEEGAAQGLGVFDGVCKRLPAGGGRKIPHMGWNNTRHRRPHKLTATTREGERFYYIHSYCAPPGEWTVMSANYGGEFCAAAAAGGVFAAQFHPEKSGDAGLRLLREFVEQ